MENISNKLYFISILLNVIFQERNQKHFGENTRKKALMGKYLGFFLLDTLKTTFNMPKQLILKVIFNVKTGK